MDDDWQLLDDYAATGSHAAFDALVRRHAPMVYGSARRRVGSADLADDVTQATFIVLARKAKSIGRRESLSAWLYRVARYTALNALRGRSRRARHERAAARAEAMTMTPADDAELAVHLDAALDALPRGERDAVLMRFIDGRTLAEVGRQQGVAESTAQRRVERSLARLARELKRRGVAPAPAAIVAALTAWAATPAPASATANLTALAAASASLPASTAGPVGLAKGTMKTMTIIKLKLAAAGIAAAATVGAGGVAIEQAVAQQARPTAIPAPAGSSLVATGPTTSPTRDVASQFRVDWGSVTLQLTRANPAWPMSEMSRRLDSQTLTVEGVVNTVDTTNIVGLDSGEPVVTRIVDLDGNDVTSLWAGQASREPWFRRLEYTSSFDQATRKWVPQLQASRFGVPLKLTDRLPRGLARVEANLRVLVCDRMESIDVPFAASETFTDVLPGVGVRFKTIEATPNGTRWELVVSKPNLRQFSGRVTADDPLPSELLMTRTFVDAAGKPTDESPGYNPFFLNVDAQSGTMSGGRTPAAFRYEVAVGVREVSVPIVLTNVAMPELKTVEATLPEANPRDLPPAARMEAALAQEIARRDERAAEGGWTPAKAETIRAQWRQFLADFDRGAGVPLKAEPVMGVTPDVASYDDYVGVYSLVGAGVVTVQVEGQPPASRPATTPRGLKVTIRKDERGRFLIDTPEGPSPAVARGGALFGVFDDVLIAPVDPLDAKGDVKLAGFWVTRAGEKTTLTMDTGRAMPAYELVREK